MRLSVDVVVKPGWILERLARELADRIPGITVNANGYKPRSPSREAIAYFLPMKDVRHMPPGFQGLKVGLFTHGDERTEIYWNQFDACVAMNRHVADHLEQLGARNVRLIRPGTEPPSRPIRFGVCGRVYGKGRKGAFLVREAIAAGYWFQACSETQLNADGTVRRGADRKPPCRITHNVTSLEERQAFYREIDYLVVTSLEEGGPMPLLEAVAHGVPVIAPDVGWCWEFPVIRYERGSWDSLREVLEGLTRPPSWESWAAQHEALFGELLRAAA